MWLSRLLCVLKHGTHLWMRPVWALRGDLVTLRCAHCQYEKRIALEPTKYAGVPERKRADGKKSRTPRWMNDAV